LPDATFAARGGARQIVFGGLAVEDLVLAHDLFFAHAGGGGRVHALAVPTDVVASGLAVVRLNAAREQHDRLGRVVVRFRDERRDYLFPEVIERHVFYEVLRGDRAEQVLFRKLVAGLEAGFDRLTGPARSTP
jgi:hypothetical protein